MDRNSDAEDSLFNTGRRAKLTVRKDIATYLEYNTIELDEIVLKRVNTAMIDRKMTTYFKCKNMKTPYRVTGICHFSGRIANFPENLEIEIINDHSPNCSYLRKSSANIPTSNIEKLKQSHLYASKNNPLVKKSKSKKKNRNVWRKLSSDSSEEDNLKYRKDFKIPGTKVFSQEAMKVIKSLKLPENFDLDADLEKADIHVQLLNDADIQKERELFSLQRDILIFNNTAN